MDILKLPGETNEIQYAILPLNSPINILRQSKAKMTSNPFIKPIDESDIILEDIVKHKNIEFGEINDNISLNFMGFMDDIFNKPDDENWINYLKIILNKDDRYSYFAILLFLIALIIIFITF